MNTHHVDPFDEDDRTIEGADLLDEIRRRLGFSAPDPGLPPPEGERSPSLDLTIDGFDLLRDIESANESGSSAPAGGSPSSASPLERWKPPALERAEPLLFGEPVRWHLGALAVAFGLGVILTAVVLLSGPFS